MKILFFILTAGALTLGGLNLKAYILDKQNIEKEPAVQETKPVSEPETVIEVEKKIRLIEKKKLVKIIEPEEVLVKKVKTVLHTEKIPVPVAIMVHRENILEEEPEKMPAWVAALPEENDKFMYFVGTRTKAYDKETALEHAYKRALEEVHLYIGTKMDYYMEISTVQENDKDADVRVRKEIQAEIIGNIPDIEKIAVKEGIYYRKIRENDQTFCEAHVLIALNMNDLKKAVETSIQKTQSDLNVSGKTQELQEKQAMLKMLDEKKNMILEQTEQERQALETKRREYEIIEKGNMSELVYELFLADKNLYFRNEKEAKKSYQNARRLLDIKINEIASIVSEEESPADTSEQKIDKRIARAAAYFSKGHALTAYEATLSALDELLTVKKSNTKMDGRLKEIEALLLKNLDKLPNTRCSGFDIVNGQVRFQKEGSGNIKAYYNPAGRLLYSVIDDPAGNAYAFYRQEKVIYKKIEMESGKAMRITPYGIVK
ncbi:MAG TPA: hypothetical protein DHW82_13255 [Spirochaetia bacterium]|nr:MAG: hypothetical protein A2Y41_12345 [Spirochaetes bacterium GWB1_36_13]HCL57957.1 hypothetical protein [Spirochaetia bacterium]